jgi:hypothetical protein
MSFLLLFFYFLVMLNYKERRGGGGGCQIGGIGAQAPESRVIIGSHRVGF